MTISFSTFIVLFLLGALLLLGPIAWSFSSRRRKSSPTPTCGSCGYSVWGLTGLTCPECGNDFRQVGIVPMFSPNSGQRGFWGDAIGFTIAMLLISYALSAILLSIAPQRRDIDNRFTLSRPASGAYKSVVVRAQKNTWNWGPLEPPIAIDLESFPSTPGATPPIVTLRIDQRQRRISYVDRAGKERIAAWPLDLDDVLAWMNQAGIDVGAASVKDEAQVMVGSVQRLEHVTPAQIGVSISRDSGPYSRDFQQMTRVEQTRNTPLPGIAIAAPIGFCAVWMAGLAFLWRTRSALIAHLTSQ